MRDERGLYERLCLEGFQSGLSWLTILRKRESFRSAFAGFDPERVARFGERDVERLLGDAGIVRHRGKIEATIANARGDARAARGGNAAARARLVVRAETYGAAQTTADWFAQTPESKELSKRLKRPASASSARRRSGRRCRRAASSTTTSPAAGCATTSSGSDETRSRDCRGRCGCRRRGGACRRARRATASSPSSAAAAAAPASTRSGQNGAGRRLIYRALHDDAPLTPAWSPNGKQIAYVPGAPLGGLWVMNANGTGRHRIVRGNGDPLFPSWSTDGNEDRLRGSRQPPLVASRHLRGADERHAACGA